MHATPFTASTDHVKFTKGEDQDVPVVNNHDTSTRVELVDVSMYEAGTMTDQSTLLNILSDRDVANMSRKDLQIFSDAGIMGQWLIYKCKQMLPGVVFFQLCDCIITCVLVFLLGTTVIGQNGSSYDGWVLKQDNKVQLDELKAWEVNRSSVLQSHTFHDLENRKRLSLQQRWWSKRYHENAEKVKLFVFNVTSLDINHDIDLDSFNNTEMDKLYELALGMPEFADNITQLRIYRLYPKIRMQFAKELNEKKSEILRGFQSVYLNVEKINETVYKNLTIEDDGDILTPSAALDVYELIAMICFPMGAFESNELTEKDFIDRNADVKFDDLAKYMYYDICYYQFFYNVAVKNKSCKNTDQLTVAKLLFRWDGNDLEDVIKLSVLVCMYMYLILDGFERCIFLTKAVVYQTSPWDMVFTALGQKVPGSYVRKQLNVLSCLAVIAQFHVEKYSKLPSDQGSSRDVNVYYSLQSYVTMIFIIAIVVRFLMHIHSLRLLPGIGHFVITTFMMGTNLLHFSAVFGIVVLIFSVLFHILIDDPDCPLEKSNGFVTLFDSIFSTFQLTFGHGDMDPFFSSALVQLTYALYVIIVGLLLLNLIIAIMSTTATEIMVDPWKEVLWYVEWLDEATSVEYTLSVITLPFRKCRGPEYYFHKKAGFIVQKAPNKKYKVYIKRFHCPALEEQPEE